MVIRRAFEEHREVFERSVEALAPVVEGAAARCVASLRAGGKVLACGNGGSAADAQHFVAELVGRFQVDRGALAAVALTTDTSILTAIANDFGYERVFSRQVAALAKPGDVLLAISTSGNSPSVVEAAKEALARGCVVIALTGEGGGRLGALSTLHVAVPSRTIARIQELHELCLHALAEAVEAELSGGESGGGGA